jgi:hypothetical protein
MSLYLITYNFIIKINFISNFLNQVRPRLFFSPQQPINTFEILKFLLFYPIFEQKTASKIL